MSDIREQAKRDAEFDRLLDAHEQVNPSKSAYTDDAMRAAYELGKRHGREDGPRWHDAPTCQGQWVNETDAYNVYWIDGKLMVEDLACMDEPWEGRWFGPIPTEEVKP